MTLLSQREARLIAKLEAAHKELTLAHHELAESREALLRTHNRLQQELRDAERYVRAILPAPITEPFAVDWLFVPSTELGGDSFGYHWIDSEHFALYLLDVCGHGVGSALAVGCRDQYAAFRRLPDTDFRLPEAVLGSLNQTFQMEHQNNLYFTIWYGVYHPPTGRLRYASAGHPPPILVSGPREERGTANACCRAREFPSGCCRPPATRARNVRSSGRPASFSSATAPSKSSGKTASSWKSKRFEEVLTRAIPNGASELDELLHFARDVHGSDNLDDDFSIIRMTI